MTQLASATAKPRPRTDSKPELTLRQETVLLGLLLARTNLDQALELNLSEYTIKYHCRSVFRLFGVANRVELFHLFVCQPERFPDHVVAQVKARATSPRRRNCKRPAVC